MQDVPHRRRKKSLATPRNRAKTVGYQTRAQISLILDIEPIFFQAWLQKAAILHQLGRYDDAEYAVREVMRIAPNLRLSSISGLYMSNDKAGLERFKDALRQAGLPG